MKKQAAVIFGGVSSEHEVSCVSVVNVVSGFDKDKYDLTLIGITMDTHGFDSQYRRWFLDKWYRNGHFVP